MKPMWTISNYPYKETLVFQVSILTAQPTVLQAVEEKEGGEIADRWFKCENLRIVKVKMW